MSETDEVSVKDSKGKPYLPPCRVCGDKAAGYHYGVNTCEACKGFFHRSLRRHKEYKCRANRTSGYCDYKPGKRKSCQFCRYKKCLDVGMSKEAIKTGRYTYLKRTEDTNEIKRLNDISCHVSPDSSASLISSSLSSPQSQSTDDALIKMSNSSGSSLSIPSGSTFMEVDSTTKDELENFLLCEIEPIETVTSFPSGVQQDPMNLSGIKENCTVVNSSTELMMSSNSKSFIHGHILRGDQSHLLDQSHIVPSTYTDNSCSDKMDTLHSAKVMTAQGNEHPKSHSPHMAAMLKTQNSFGNSLMYRLLSTENDTDSTIVDDDLIELAHKSYTNELERLEKQSASNSSLPADPALPSQSQVSNLTSQSLGVFQGNVISPCSLPNTGMTRSRQRPGAELATTKDYLKGMDIHDYELLPYIFGDVEGRSSNTSSPLSKITSAGSPSVSPSSGFPTCVTSQDHDIIVSSPGAVVLDLDNGRRFRIQNSDPSVVTSLSNSNTCNVNIKDVPSAGGYLPCPGQPIRIQEEKDEENDVELELKEKYNREVEIQPQSKSKSAVQALLTRASPCSARVKSSSPLPSPIPLPEEDFVPRVCPRPKASFVRKDLTPSEIPNLFQDKDEVIAVLMEAHKQYILDFDHVSKDEMVSQQKAHFEACSLKNKTFGSLEFLPEKEYDDIYSVTGMDVDNRRRMIAAYLTRMERCVRGLVQFSKSIPGFSSLDINTQVDLIKLSRSEFAMLTTYPTVNLELGVSMGLSGLWMCMFDVGKLGNHCGVTEYLRFCDRLQKLDLNREEIVLLKAMVLVSTDRDSTVSSPLADAIRWELCQCLMYCLEKRSDRPSTTIARYILALAQARSVADKFKDFLKSLRMDKYSTIEQNPLMWEMYSWIIHEKGNQMEDDGRGLDKSSSHFQS